MKPTRMMLSAVACLGAFLVPAARAGDADTSASATGGRGTPGTAAASAHYAGDVGFARTDTRTGQVNLARGVALGVDRDGLALSLSSAIAPARGPALATTFNLSLDRDGHVATSVGSSVASGGRERSVSVEGGATTRGTGTATALASGRAAGGRVVAHTDSYQSGPRPLFRPDVRLVAAPVVARPMPSLIRPAVVEHRGYREVSRVVRTR